MLNTRSENLQIRARVFGSLLTGAIVSILIYSSAGFAQNRVDLDDLNIKGELLNDNRMRLSARDPHKMAERVTYRENFRPEIIDGLEVAWPEKAADQGIAGLNKSTSSAGDQ